MERKGEVNYSSSVHFLSEVAIAHWIRKEDLLEGVKDMKEILAGSGTMLVKGKYIDVSEIRLEDYSISVSLSLLYHKMSFSGTSVSLKARTGNAGRLSAPKTFG